MQMNNEMQPLAVRCPARCVATIKELRQAKENGDKGGDRDTDPRFDLNVFKYVHTWVGDVVVCQLLTLAGLLYRYQRYLYSKKKSDQQEQEQGAFDVDVSTIFSHASKAAAACEVLIYDGERTACYRLVYVRPTGPAARPLLQYSNEMRRGLRV